MVVGRGAKGDLGMKPRDLVACAVVLWFLAWEGMLSLEGLCEVWREGEDR